MARPNLSRILQATGCRSLLVTKSVTTLVRKGMPMDHKNRPWSLLVLTLVMAACGRVDGEATSLAPQATTAATTGVADASIADSAPPSSLRPPVGSYRQRYLSVSAQLIVYCMNDLGWEATYDPRHGAILAEVPPSQVIERDGVMRFCVAGSHNNHGIYAD